MILSILGSIMICFSERTDFFTEENDRVIFPTMSPKSICKLLPLTYNIKPFIFFPHISFLQAGSSGWDILSSVLQNFYSNLKVFSRNHSLNFQVELSAPYLHCHSTCSLTNHHIPEITCYYLCLSHQRATWQQSHL